MQFKVVMLGNMSVGKTSMALRFVRNQFFEYQEGTIGGGRALPRSSQHLLLRGCSDRWTRATAAFLTKSLVLDDTTIKFEIWDTAGQERFASLAPMYYRGAAAAIVRRLPDSSTCACARALSQLPELTIGHCGPSRRWCMTSLRRSRYRWLRSG